MIDHNNLEEFSDPINYDLEEGKPSVARIAFYSELAESVGDPVLEIACGTGLVAIPVAARGLDVTGVDLARPMLEYARTKSQQLQLPIRWIEADARQLNLGRQYQFIFITGNAFQAFLRREDQEALLASAAQHLTEDGIFAFETRNPSGHNLNSFDEEEQWFTYTSIEGHFVTVSGTQTFEPISQVMHWTTYRRWHDGKRENTKKTRIACRFTYPQELVSLLYYNNFEIVQQYGNWNKEPLTANSPTMMTICKRRKL